MRAVIAIMLFSVRDGRIFGRYAALIDLEILGKLSVKPHKTWVSTSRALAWYLRQISMTFNPDSSAKVSR